jgi:hypothetical protein
MDLDQSHPVETSRIRRIINQHRSRYPDGIPISVVKAKSESAGIETEFVDKFIEREKELGRLYSPAADKIDVT